jgi:hypothetical protein
MIFLNLMCRLKRIESSGQFNEHIGGYDVKEGGFNNFNRNADFTHYSKNQYYQKDNPK